MGRVWRARQPASGGRLRRCTANSVPKMDSTTTKTMSTPTVTREAMSLHMTATALGEPQPGGAPFTQPADQLVPACRADRDVHRTLVPGVAVERDGFR